MESDSEIIMASSSAPPTESLEDSFPQFRSSASEGTETFEILNDDNQSLKLSLLTDKEQEKLDHFNDGNPLGRKDKAKLQQSIKNGRRVYDTAFSIEELDILENLFLLVNMAQDGVVEVSELKFFLDLHDYVISDQEARQIIKAGDMDGDCALNFEEFLSLCHVAELKVQPTSQEGFLDSLKIRKIFQAIFAPIDFHPHVRETVEFFESKIAEGFKGSEALPSRNSPQSKKQEEAGCKNNSSYTVLNVRESRPLQLIGGDECKKTNSTKCAVEIPPGGDTIVDELLSTSVSKESLVDETQNIEGIINQEMLKIQHEADKAGSQVNSEFDYDLIVIGGGTGGSAAAKEASKLGKRVAICDFMMPSTLVKSWGWRFGGSCVNVGCVPRMLMHHSGLIGEYLDKKTSLPFGWFAPESEKNFSMNWSTLIDNIQSHIRTLNYERQFGLSYYKGIKYFNTHCEFDGPHSILLTHEEKRKEYITGEKILISVGSLYEYLDVPGAAGNCITVDDIFSHRNHPGKVLIVGGGPDAIECAGLLCSLNIEVTLMSRSQALKGFDRRMVTLILETLHSRGVKIMVGWSPTEIINEVDAAAIQKQGIVRNLTVVAKHKSTGERSSYLFNTVVLAVGKKPCTPLLKLERAEVLLDEMTNKIWVDSQDMTTAEDIFAIGDCASDRPSGTPISYQAGISLSRRLFEGSAQVTEYDQTLPKFLMTPVEYACIGLSEEAAIFEHGEPNVQVYHSRFQPLQYQLSNRFKDTYYAKLITLKPERELVIGLHYLGPNAGEIMQGFSLAMKFKATKSDFDSMIGIHPTCSEIFTKMTKTSAAQAGDETSC